MRDPNRLTNYQLELLGLVKEGNPDKEEGGPIDFDQLLETLSWKPAKASAHFSIRALVKRGLLKKTPALILRRGRQRVGFVLTLAGRQVFDPREGVGFELPEVDIPSPEVDEDSPSGVSFELKE